MKTNINLLTSVLVNPATVLNFTQSEWELLIRQARASILLAKLFELFQQEGILCRIPEQPGKHLTAANKVAQRYLPVLSREVIQLLRLLGPLDQDLVMLKGAAYCLADLPAAKGRLFSDIDILVEARRLGEIEISFRDDGWIGQSIDIYDQRYYRKWMHEIPPLTHYKRRTQIDIHHTILPPTSRYHPDPAKLFAASIEIADGVRALCPEDMVIHSATHLFHEGEFDHGLRDLVDIHELLTHFGEHEAGFWERLAPRAIELDLIRPLYYGLRYSTLILETDVPKEVVAQADEGRPSPIMNAIMDFLFMRALMPDHPSCDRRFTGLARWLLYVRSHYLRMPLRLLVPHLVRKAWKRRFDKPEALVPVAGEEK